jgi:hypothetical protein
VACVNESSWTGFQPVAFLKELQGIKSEIFVSAAEVIRNIIGIQFRCRTVVPIMTWPISFRCGLATPGFGCAGSCNNNSRLPDGRRDTGATNSYGYNSLQNGKIQKGWLSDREHWTDTQILFRCASEGFRR